MSFDGAICSFVHNDWQISVHAQSVEIVADRNLTEWPTFAILEAMSTKPQFRFSIATLLWLMVCVAVFFGGWFAREPQIKFEQAKAEQQRALAQATVAEAHALAYQQRLISERLVAQQQLMPFRNELMTDSFVIEVSDGDAVSILTDKELTRVRIVGIDCPESNQPFGDEARQFTTTFCMKRNVELVGDETDQYGRRLADVLVDGQSLRKALLSAGLAWHYKKLNDDPELAMLEREAKAKKVGLWADAESVPPWDWRK